MPVQDLEVIGGTLGVSERGDFDPRVTAQQIGHMNILTTSGGRIVGAALANGSYQAIEFPVSSGYSVRVSLAGDDTYTVQRIMRRGSKTWIKGEQTGVYCDEVGEAVYQAGSYKSNAFGGHTP